MGFETFIGNPKAVETVRGLVRSGRVPGALLFTGPDGVGKKTLAIELGKALNCQGRALSGDACGQCRHCVKAAQMVAAAQEDLERRRQMKDAQRRAEGLLYFDLQLIGPLTRFILIEQIRQLRSSAYTRPFELARRVFIIDEAHSIHWQAVDLLLKVLEEPPETTTLILVTSHASALRATIRSRCRPVAFLPVADALLRQLLEQEGRVPAPKRELATRLAAGSVAAAKAFDLADYERRRKPWMDYFETLARRAAGREPDWDHLFQSTRLLAEMRDEVEESLRIGLRMLRDMELVCEMGNDAPLANLDIAARVATWASALGRAGIARLHEGLEEAARLQIRNVNQQLGLDSLALELMSGRV